MSTTAQALTKNKDLQNRLLFTLFILALYRLGTFVPTPGVDSAVISEFFKSQGAGLLGMVNTFTGGALGQLTVFALGIMPYISSSIIFQVLTAVVPHFTQLKKEGQQGQKKIQQYTRYGTVVLAIIQAFAISKFIMGQNFNGQPLLLSTSVGGIPFQLMTVITLTAGSMIVVWLGEQISERGLGEGASMIIFAGIAAGIPSGTFNLIQMVSKGQINGLVALLLIIFMVVVIAAIIFLEIGQRRLPIHVSQRGGGGQAQQMSSHLPLKLNMSGVIPPIFASSLLMFPATVAGLTEATWVKNLEQFFSPSSGLYTIIFVALIIFFCFFYTEIVFPPGETADNLKKSGKFIPGIRAGKSTAEYIKRVIDRITVGGALYLSLVCVLPTILISKMNTPFYFGGTSLLILVGVAINLIEKINAYRYEHLMKASTSAAKRGSKRRRVQF